MAMKLRPHRADFAIGVDDGFLLGSGIAKDSLRQQSGKRGRGASASESSTFWDSSNRSRQGFGP
jgi:hypothetical protein